MTLPSFWQTTLAFNMAAVIVNIVASASGLIPPVDAGAVCRHALAGLFHLGLVVYVYHNKPPTPSPGA